ncbi:Uncharacterised protein [Sphingobacterium multivorum]|uniref:Uncharacterized protein n=2 Tax=Sphingobacteriaceae TaxID=84566 RepID=A0A654DHA4_SPHMU|nr:Uncharacterised protein [Sphingobacterium multivorum]VXD05339.1 conserved hypothetical protein [Sphingobacterium multivorum]
MALRAKIEESPIAGEIKMSYGRDFYQEEVRSTGLAMIRDGWDMEGEQLILDFVHEHYPMRVKDELTWINKMMHYLAVVTDTFIDNLHAEGYRFLQGNVDMPNEHAIFYPVHELDAFGKLSQELGMNTIVDLKISNQLEQLQGWIYYRSGSN